MKKCFKTENYAREHKAYLSINPDLQAVQFVFCLKESHEINENKDRTKDFS